MIPLESRLMGVLRCAQLAGGVYVAVVGLDMVVASGEPLDAIKTALGGLLAFEAIRP